MYCIIYTDKLGGRIMLKSSNYIKAIDKLIEVKQKGARDGAVYKEPFHSTTQEKPLCCFFGSGSYWDNVSKEDNKVEKKRL
tara:strand:+ start:4912 stop:5154 length:243 start_codon:yes stop_codon:yes gene_type:complete